MKAPYVISNSNGQLCESLSKAIKAARRFPRNIICRLPDCPAFQIYYLFLLSLAKGRMEIRKDAKCSLRLCADAACFFLKVMERRNINCQQQQQHFCNTY